MSLLLLSVRVAVTVDRIEPPFAVVEWPSGDLADVPLALLPSPTAEGDTIELRLGRSRQGSLAAGSPTFLMTPQGLLPLPGMRRVVAGHRYTFRFQPQGARAHPNKENDSHVEKNHPHPR